MSRHTGDANLPLHTGKAPAWLLSRMTRLAREIAVHVVADQGPAELLLPSRHALQFQDRDRRHLQTVLLSTYDRAPGGFESLLGLAGVGARTLRALALVSEVIDGTPASTRDPLSQFSKATEPQ